MLQENIKAFRQAKGLSQEELAVRLHVVRQTISKWENGLSVPDSDLLIALSQALETPVSTLLGETADVPAADDVNALAEKLETINLQLARAKAARRKALHLFLLACCASLAAIAAVLFALHSPYLNWDFDDPEIAVAGTILHAFEWLFARCAPFLFAGAAVGAFLTRNKP